MYIEFEDNVLDTCCPNKSHISPILENFLYATTCQMDLVWIAGAAVMIFYFFKVLCKVALCCFNYSITAFKTACFLTNGLYHTTKFNYRYALYV